MPYVLYDPFMLARYALSFTALHMTLYSMHAGEFGKQLGDKRSTFVCNIIIHSKLQGNPHDLRDVQKFLVSAFDSMREDRTQALNYHFITSTSTRNIRHFFELVKDTILTPFLQDIMEC